MSQLTITEAAIQEHIFAKLQPNEQNIIMRVYQAGMKMIFSPATHQQMMDEFDKQMQMHNDLAGNLGTDIAHIMIILFQQSKGTMPQGAMIPAGTMLLAKICEFLDTTKSAQITDDDFAEATHLMATVLMSKFDKKYAQSVGAQQHAPSLFQGQQAPQSQQQTQPAQPQATGMIGG